MRIVNFPAHLFNLRALFSISEQKGHLLFRKLGLFVAGIPAPLGIGPVELDDGESVNGFLCEEFGTRNAQDITAYGDARRYLSQICATHQLAFS